MKQLVFLFLLTFSIAICEAQNTVPNVNNVFSFNIPNDPVVSESVVGFVNIPTIKGESTEEGFEGQIEIYGMSWNSGREFPSSLENGVTRFGSSPLVLSKKMDQSTPYILEAFVSGQVIPKVEIQLTNHTDSRQMLVSKIELNNVSVIQFQSEYGDHVHGKNETVSIIFEHVKMTYITQTPDHDGGKKHVVEFNLNSN